MNPKNNAAAIKILEAAKIIQALKEPDFAERREDILRHLYRVSAQLLEDKPKIADKIK